RIHARFNYWPPYPVLYVKKLGFFDFFRTPIEVQNISKSGLLAKVTTSVKFTASEKLIIEFDNYFTEVIPASIIRRDPENHLVAIKFSREIKLIERIALNIC
ncbi:MAG: PilZ domain-containing protein, partial [Moritella sp.]|uniref:PilZ domain-containing protein n=1 Tax=Moritella sp. TaxID=78556 RepID=UPI0029AD4A1D